MKNKDRTGDQLRARGFDRTVKNKEEGTWKVRCSQCEVLVIQGVATHEHGCPNGRYG